MHIHTLNPHQGRLFLSPVHRWEDGAQDGVPVRMLLRGRDGGKGFFRFPQVRSGDCMLRLGRETLDPGIASPGGRLLLGDRWVTEHSGVFHWDGRQGGTGLAWPSQPESWMEKNCGIMILGKRVHVSMVVCVCVCACTRVQASKRAHG